MEDIRFEEKNLIEIQKVGYVSVVRNNGYSFEYKQGKDLCSFIYVENGELEYSFSSQREKMRIKKGDVLYIPSRLPYKTDYLADNTTIRIIIFDTDKNLINTSFSQPICKNSHDAAEVFLEISPENLRNTLILCSAVYRLIHIFLSGANKISKKYAKILPAISEINKKYYENKKLSYYADMCNMSESNFRLLFKEYTGKSPIEYRNRIRIIEARKMIDSGEFTVGEAAYNTGFNNMSFFYEMLKNL